MCKYFLEAIENNKYGWFWVCPGGGDNCMYRHALPPGFVLKKDKKKEEKEEEISLEELIEKEVRRLAHRYACGHQRWLKNNGFLWRDSTLVWVSGAARILRDPSDFYHSVLTSVSILSVQPWVQA